MRTRIVLSSLILASFLYWTSPSIHGAQSHFMSVDQATRETVSREAKTMLLTIPSDLSRDGPIAWLRYFDADPNFLMATDGKLQFDGFESAQVFLDSFAKNISHVELVWTNVRVDSLSATTAGVGASYAEELTDKEGHRNQVSGYFTGVVVQTPRGWKLRSAHW